MNIEYFKQLQEIEAELCVSKNKAYGDNNITKFGLKGVIIRMNDKIERLIRLGYEQDITDEIIINEESLRDTLMDLSNYANIAIMIIDGEWKKK